MTLQVLLLFQRQMQVQSCNVVACQCFISQTRSFSLRTHRLTCSLDGSAQILQHPLCVTSETRCCPALLMLHPAPLQSAPDLSAFKECMPPHAIMYLQDAPRPRNPLRTAETLTPEHALVEEFIAANAPRVGARPCWSCPFCVSFSFFEHKLSFFRHVREKHNECTLKEETRNMYMSNADNVVLVWCVQAMKGGKRCGAWEALRGLK